ncbi:hypothetical protein ACJ41O_005769 [Fusarium nematophilum]
MGVYVSSLRDWAAESENLRAGLGTEVIHRPFVILRWTILGSDGHDEDDDHHLAFLPWESSSRSAVAESARHQTTKDNPGGQMMPWNSALATLRHWFQGSDDESQYLTYGEYQSKDADVQPAAGPSRPTNPPSPDPMELSFRSNRSKSTERQLADKYIGKMNEHVDRYSIHSVHSVHSLPPLQPDPSPEEPTRLRFWEYSAKAESHGRPGLKSIFSRRQVHFDSERWESMIPEGVHSCHYCRHLLIDSTELESLIEHDSVFLILSELEEAAAAGCTLFHWLKEFIQDSRPLSLAGEERFFGLSLVHLKPPSNDIWSIGFAALDNDHFNYELRGSLGVFVCDGNPEAEFVSGRPLNCDVASEENFRDSRRWLEECHKNHPACRGSHRGYMPSRVLEISEDGRIKLIETKRQREGKYAALSYCWGGDQSFKLTKGNLPKLREAIASKDLPQTITDAILVTKRLGLSYLWVDSLCIIQDSVEDQKKEIPLMAEIFELAYVTISAASARSSSDGFLQRRKPDTAVIPYILPTAELGSLRLYKEMDAADEPIHSRAWTLQEHVHACRILEYGTQKLRRVCRGVPLSADLQELRDLAPPNMMDPARIGIWQKKEAILRHRWQPLVKNYTERQLTKASDRPLGIYAIAREYSRMLDSEYKGGLWGRFLKQDLLWQRDTSSPRQSRRLDLRCPTWSWLSVDSATIVWRVAGRSADETLEIKQCHVKDWLFYEEEPLDTHSRGGDLACLTVKGRVRKASWVGNGDQLISSGCIVAQVVADVGGEGEMGEREVPVTCLEVIRDTAGLVLVPLDPGSRDYRRLGLWTIGIDDQISAKGEEWLKTGKKKRLSIY